MGWEKIVDILSWIKDKLPIANRVEGIKNNIDKLEREKNEILSHPANEKSANRLKYINSQLDILRVRMQNCAKD